MAINLLGMNASIGPSVGEIFSAERGVRGKKVAFGDAQSAEIFEKPHGYSSSDDAGITTADAGRGVDSRKVVAEVLDNPLQKLRLFASG